MAARSEALAEEAAGPGHLLPLAACAGLPVGRVGRKASVLAWAAGRGVATPGGVVVGAERFREALAVCGAAERARYLEEAAHHLAPHHVLDVAASVAEALRSPAVAALARADADAALRRVGGGGPVVCRSSSAMEDGRGAAFPGMFLSVLGIGSAAGLADAIAACWRSAFAEDAVRYLLRVRAEPVDLSLAVLVQRQVAAARFGVYVSADPVTGAPVPCAELGDATPDALMGAGRATVRARRDGGRWATPDGAGPAAAPSLEALHRVAGRLRRRLGAEVDVEFALPAGDGPPVVLQCRPLTGVGSAPAGPAPADGALAGRGCAAGSATGVATAGGPGIAVVEELTASDYGVVFRSAGVVTERDASALSHAAILCRELGVPLVCGVAGARDRLVGRRVAVDGRSGHVRVLDGDTPAATPAAAPPPSLPTDSGEPVVGAVELLLRLLAEARPGRPVAAEVDRVARRCARDLGGRAVLVAPSPVDGADLERLERLGADVLGPDFSAAAFLAGVEGTRRPAAP